MEGFTPPSGADRELDELRRRAYGRDPDIGVDPSALARLRELEAAHRAGVNRRADAPPSDSESGTNPPPEAASATTSVAEGRVPEPPRRPAAEAPPAVSEGWSPLLVQRAMAPWSRLTWRSRVAWALGSLVVAGGILATVVVISTPRPDATLHLTAMEADSEVRRLVAEEVAWLEIDTSTLRGYGSYLGLQIWSGVNAFDSPCLVALHRANGNLSESRCAPSAAVLIMDVSSFGDGFEGFPGVAGNGIIRFVAHDDTVDAYVYVMPEAD